MTEASPSHRLPLVVLHCITICLDHEEVGDLATAKLVLSNVKGVDLGVVVVCVDFGELEGNPRVSVGLAEGWATSRRPT